MLLMKIQLAAFNDRLAHCQLVNAEQCEHLVLTEGVTIFADIL